MTDVGCQTILKFFYGLSAVTVYSLELRIANVDAILGLRDSFVFIFYGFKGFCFLTG